MSKIQCFKTKPGSDFDKDVKRHFKLRPKWSEVFKRVGLLLGEEIKEMVLNSDELYIKLSEIKNPENKKLFTKDGKLKGNSKKANEIRKRYKEIINEEGLSRYEELSFLKFAYGVMRMRGQELESFRTSEDDIYFKADFDLEEKSEGAVTPITEIQYQEKYIEELKKKENIA